MYLNAMPPTGGSAGDPLRDATTVEAADCKILLLYIIAILTSLFFVTKFALGL